MPQTKLETYFFSIVFIATLALSVRIVYPFLGALALALVLAVLGMPVYTALRRRTQRDSVAALLVVVLMTIAVLLPAALLFFVLIAEVTTFSQALALVDVHAVQSRLLTIEHWLTSFFPFFASIDIAEIVHSITEGVGGYAVNIITNAAGVILKLVVAIVALYYFLKDGNKFIIEIIRLSPLTDGDDALIIERLRAVSQSLIKVTLFIAILQGALIGLGFLMFSIPGPILWGVVATVASLLPMIGTGFVYIPAVLYLWLTGDITAAVGLGAWCVLVVSVVDDLVRPHLMGKSTQIHPLFVLLSVLGGLAFFGIGGFLLGPLILGFLISLAGIYSVKIHNLHQEQGSVQ